MSRSEIGLSKAILLFKILSVGRERLQRLAGWHFARAQYQNVREPDAPMGADTTEREQTDVHPPPHKRAGDAQNGSGMFGRDLRIISKHRHAIASRKLIKKIGKGW